MRYSLKMRQEAISHNQNLTAIMEAYQGRLTHYATRRLRYSDTAVMDADDAVSQAITSFWQGVEDGRFSITCEEDVYYILHMLVGCKCVDQQRYVTCSRRSSRLTQVLDDDIADGLLGTDPEPSSTLASADMLSYVLSRMDEQDRKILSLRLDGWEHQDIADHLGMCAKTVSRRLLAIRDVVKVI